MSVPAMVPHCRACGAQLEPPGHFCPRCQAPQQQLGWGQPAGMVGAKSAGIAVLLSFLWLGAGHLYANQTVTGVLLIIWDSILVLLSLTGIGLILSVPLWLISAPIVMVLSARAANEFNRRNGIIVR